MKVTTSDQQKRRAYRTAGQAVIGALIGAPPPDRVTKSGSRRKTFGKPVHEALIAVAGMLAEAKSGAEFDPPAADRVLKAAGAMLKGTAETAEHLVEVASCLVQIAKVDEAVCEVAGLLLAGEELEDWQIEAICEEHHLPLAKAQPAATWYLKRKRPVPGRLVS
jgi:hypothetical protein